ncbi:MAG: hypothetical protein ACE5K4_00420 [Candidatus Hydrothermarchaeota archaeon]
MGSRNLSKYEVIAFSIILIHLILLVLNFDALPNDQKDWTYHQMVARMFTDHQSLLWDYYEFAPVGRPHLYPPLLHTIFASSHLLGLEFLTIQRLYGIIMYITSFFIIWFVSKDFFDDKIALLSVLFLSMPENYFWWQLSIAPTSLIFGIYPLIFWSFIKSERIAILLLTISLWTHLAAPWTAILGLLIFSLIKREYLKRFFKVLSISLFLFLPWGLHVISNFNWIHGRIHALRDINLDLIIALFGIIGIYSLFKSRRDVDVLLIASVIGLIPTAYTYSWRFWIHFPSAITIPCAVGARNLANDFGKYGFHLVLCLLIILSLTFSPSITIRPFPEETLSAKEFKQMKENLPRQLIQEVGGIPRGREFFEGKNYLMKIRKVPTPLHLEILALSDKQILRQDRAISRDSLELYNWIMENTYQNEILHVENGFTACAISLFTDRRTDNGAWREVLQPWIITQSKNANIRYAILERKNVPREYVLARFGEYIVVRTEDLKNLIQKPPQFFFVLAKLSDQFEEISDLLLKDREKASESLFHISKQLERISMQAKDPKIRKIIGDTAYSLEILSKEVMHADQKRLREISSALKKASYALKIGDIGAFLDIINSQRRLRTLL